MKNWSDPLTNPPQTEGSYTVAALPPNHASIPLDQLNKWRKLKGSITAWFDGENWYGYLHEMGQYGRIEVTHWKPCEIPPILSEINSVI